MSDLLKLQDQTRKLEELVKQLCECRKLASGNMVQFKVYQAKNMDSIKKDSRAGIDMFELMTIKYNPEMEVVYSEWKNNESMYKAYERAIECQRDAINTTKTLLKAENYGV